MAFKQFQADQTGNWSDPSNWIAGDLPEAGDTVVVYSDGDIGPGSYSYDTLVGFQDTTLTLDPGATVVAGSTYLLGSSLVGGVLQTGLLNLIAGTIEGTTVVGAEMASGFTSADLGLAGVLSVDLQPGDGTDVLTVTDQLTIAGSTELQFGEIDLQNARLGFAGTGTDATVTIDAAAVLRATTGGMPGLAVVAAAADGGGMLVNDGLLSVDAGETLAVAATLVNAGTLTVGSAGVLELAGRETLAQFGTIASDGQVAFSGTLDDTGVVTDFSGAAAGASVTPVDGAAGVTWRGGTVEGGTMAGTGQVIGDGAEAAVLDDVTFSGALALASGVWVQGQTTLADGATLTVASAGTSVAGTVVLGDGARLIAPAPVAGTTAFEGAAGTLELTGTGQFSMALSGFAPGDSVQFDGIGSTGMGSAGMGSATLAWAGDVLTVSDGATSAALTMTGRSAPYGAGDFRLGAGAGGGVVLTMVEPPAATPPIQSQPVASPPVATQPGAGSVAAAPPAPAVPSDPLFDAGFYLAHNPDVAAAGVDPLLHYEAFGFHEGRDPNPLFDPRYYLAANPDVAASGMDPLEHYEVFGGSEGRDPAPEFDDRFYLAANPDVAASGMNPLLHYETFGWHEGRNPSPLFETNYYLAQNPGVAAAGVDPLVDYVTGGWQAGRNPDPLFDTNYYLLHNPDVAASGMDPLVHYDEFGWKEGRNPSAAFDTDAYLAHNRDVAAAGIDPLAHYLSNGAAEGRAIYAVT